MVEQQYVGFMSIFQKAKSTDFLSRLIMRHPIDRKELILFL